MDSTNINRDLKKTAFDKHNEGLNTYYKTKALAVMIEALGYPVEEGLADKEVFIGIGEILREHAVTIKSIAHTIESMAFQLKE